MRLKQPCPALPKQTKTFNKNTKQKTKGRKKNKRKEKEGKGKRKRAINPKNKEAQKEIAKLR